MVTPIQSTIETEGMTEKKQRGGAGRGQGRKVVGADRGGVVPVPVSLFRDQAEWLSRKKNKSAVIRDLIDEAMNGKIDER